MPKKQPSAQDDETPVQAGPPGPARWSPRPLWTRYRAHLGRRYRRVLVRPRPDPLPASIRAARPLVIAEALVLLLIGFSLDDLHVLRVPGFLVGMVGALLVLVFGGIWHGASWAGHVRHLDPDRRETALAQRQTWGRAALTVTSFVFVVWLAVFASGVPPWTA